MVLSVLASLLVLVPGAQDAVAKTAGITVGVVIDGPWERNESVLALFVTEIEDLIGADFGGRVPAAKVIIGDWTSAGVRSAIDRQLGDPEVDILLALGVLASNEAAQRTNLPKPVIAPVVLDPDLQSLPSIEGTTGVRNLNYVAIPQTFEEDFRAFLEITPMRRMVVLMSEPIIESIPALSGPIAESAAEIGLEITVIPVGSAEEALASLPEGTDGVYVAPLHAWPPSEIDLLAAGLIERRLPSFVRLDVTEVERGFLATRTPLEFFSRLARRVALNIQSILLGTDAGDLPTQFQVPARLTINMATAYSIQVFPPWKVMTEAELLNERVRPLVRTLTLDAAIREAIRVNLDLAAQDQAVAAGVQDIARARSRLLPQIDVSSTATLIDRDRAEASFGSQAQRTLTGSATLSQLLFSEPAWADVSIQRSLQDIREFERDAIELDISLAASTAYLNILRAKTLERIQKENLDVTRTNLDKARVRVRIGSARPTEVYRWESQLAVDRQAVIDASATRNLAEIGLNRLLHRPLEEPFGTEETDLEDPMLPDIRRFYSYMDNRWSFRVFRQFLAAEALTIAPELRAFDRSIGAQNRALSSARRSFWSPAISLQAGVTGLFGEGGAGVDASGLSTGSPLSGIPQADDVSWNVGFSVSLPLFEGGARVAQTRQASAEVTRLTVEREAAAERIEQRVRSALHVMGASYASIDLSKDASAAAKSNFDLVSDAYARGAVTILDLLDAQNAFLVAELGAADAVYDFLVDLMEVQRAIGSFSFVITAEERELFLQRMDEYFEQNQP